MIRKVSTIQTDSREFNQIQQTLGKAINSLIDAQILNGNLLVQVSLASGDTAVDHKLGRPLIGWIIVRRHASYTSVYDKQDTNSIPDLTLVLNSSGVAVVDLYVF